MSRSPSRSSVQWRSDKPRRPLQPVATGTNGATQTTTTTTDSSGVVTEYTPGQSIFLKTEAAEPVQYRFAETVTYVTADGKVIETSRVRKDSKVRVHYIKEGDDMLVDKVIVTDRD